MSNEAKERRQCADERRQTADGLIRKAESIGFKMKIIPFACFQDIVEDIGAFGQREDLNNFQKWIATERYMLDMSKLDFKPESIIMAAVRFKLYTVTFAHQGRRAKTLVDVPVWEEEISSFLTENGVGRLFYDYWLPQKRLAVRSGLAEYGKNNICYVNGLGSLITLFTYITDLPCEGEYEWHEVKNMESCESCELCSRRCPTGAIVKDRFLIDNEKCLTSMNEWGTDDFPDWVPKTAHHRVVNCFLCQECCPGNKGQFADIAGEVDFSEEETELLLAGAKRESLPKELSEKLDRLGMNWFYESLPRNLKAMLENEEVYI